jgi:hypothetical protein
VQPHLLAQGGVFGSSKGCTCKLNFLVIPAEAHPTPKLFLRQYSPKDMQSAFHRKRVVSAVGLLLNQGCRGEACGSICRGPADFLALWVILPNED